jgi:hypothetical protein
MTLLAALFVPLVASGVRVTVGRRRDRVVAAALSAGVLAAGALGYFALLALALPR